VWPELTSGWERGWWRGTGRVDRSRRPRGYASGADGPPGRWAPRQPAALGAPVGLLVVTRVVAKQVNWAQPKRQQEATTGTPGLVGQTEPRIEQESSRPCVA
jgi:hypothetical protein